MKLIVNELKAATPTYQSITVNKNSLLVAVRPHLYIHSNPSGSLKIQILDSNDELITESETLIISDITTSSYFHGYVRFYVNLYLKKDVEYKIKLASTGYTYSKTSYVGWCNGFDLNKYEMDYTPVNLFTYPLDVEFWTRTP